MICTACHGSGIARVKYVCGNCAGMGVICTAEDDDPLVDRMVGKWSEVLSAILEEHDLPEAVRCDWRNRLVSLSFLDPKARAALHRMGGEIQHWQRSLCGDAALISRHLRELADLCGEYQHAAADGAGLLQGHRTRPDRFNAGAARKHVI
jgi:hypothetical protein